MLRKSPTRTEPFLAANRCNALRCTGPRTPEGKARVSLNALKHGRYAERLPEKLEAAGYRSAAALYAQILSEVVTTFKVEDPVELKQAERVTALVWTMAWRAGIFGCKPQSDLFCLLSTPLFSHETPIRFRIKDHQRRIGLVYWVQRRRYWTAERLCQDLMSDEPVPIPAVGQVIEDKLRKRAFRLGRPRFVERMQYRLDRDGVFDPDAPPPDPALLCLH
ncbi:MAG: hypothetical protein ACLQOO_25835 [Terriglobia bacterium]